MPREQVPGVENPDLSEEEEEILEQMWRDISSGKIVLTPDPEEPVSEYKTWSDEEGKFV